MENKSLQSLGGQARAKQQRESAMMAYYLFPNYCLHCEKLIEVLDNAKVSQIKLKKFCTRNCYWQSKVGKVSSGDSKQQKPKLCRRCNKEITPIITGKKFCDFCRYASYKSLDLVTKGELFDKSCNWQSARSSLRRHAYRTFKRTRHSMTCYVCGYDKHVEIAHLRPVSHFESDALISEINALKNLVALCPNHHWEFDNKILSLNKYN